jgi:hypothetical protein
MTATTATGTISVQTNPEYKIMTSTNTNTPVGSSSSSSEKPHQNPMENSILAFQKALDKIYKHGRTSSANGEAEMTVLCLVTLSKVLDNILLERQYNPKTRSIKLGNKLFRERVGSVPGGGESLRLRFVSAIEYMRFFPFG